MSIKSELEKTASYLREARKAILERGGYISEYAGLKDLPSAIANITYDLLSYIIDDSIAKYKEVPPNAEKYALLSKIGGMTYKQGDELIDSKVEMIDHYWGDNEAIYLTDIPFEVQRINGYGRGVNSDSYNYIEYRDGRWYFVKCVEEKIFNGAETFTMYSPASWDENEANGMGCMVFDLSGKKVGQQTSICNFFNNSDFCYNPTNENCVVGNYCDYYTGSRFYFVAPYAKTEDWKKHLKSLYNSGTPLIVYYALAEPIETDITDLMDGFSPLIRVEGGYNVTFEPIALDRPVPSTIKYLVKVGS